ncbi:capsid assembly protein [Salmonella phage 19]|nr:capsid assembly protein [Salmonella phage 19]
MQWQRRRKGSRHTENADTIDTGNVHLNKTKLTFGVHDKTRR